MDVGIVGLPGSGKTTLFNALTGGHAAGYTGQAHVGVANIPDPRLQVIATYISTRKIVPATLRLVDIPGVPAGGDPRKLNTVLEQMRQVDATCLLVRCFDDGRGAVDPEADLSAMETELILADLAVAESALEKAGRTARSGEKEALERCRRLEQVVRGLGEGEPVRGQANMSEGDRAALGSFGFVTARPILYVANIDETALGASTPAAAELVRARAAAGGGQSVTLCAKLEAELAELEEADRQEMLESLGLAEPAIGPLARAAHALLGLTTFYTAGDKEVRAWTIHRGATAPEAAGAIHTDLQRGFIRAECYHVDDLVKHGSEKAIRQAGRLRSEGKGYTMQDGDVVHVLFNV